MTPFVVSGLITGLVYAMFAQGIVLMYQTTGVLNFAYGAMGMLGAYVFATLTIDLNAWVAYLIVVLGAPFVGAAIGVVTRPVQGVSTLVKTIAALALISALQGFVLIAWGTDPRPTPNLTTSVAFRVGGTAVTGQQVVTAVVVVIAGVAMVALLRFSEVGAALRAMATELKVARLIGLPVARLWVLSWALSFTIAVVGAILVLPQASLSPTPLAFVVLPAVAASVAVGLDRPGLAALIALGIGCIESVLNYRTSWSSYRGALPFVVLVVGLAVASRRGRTVWERV